jgi:hypothetical protein
MLYLEHKRNRAIFLLASTVATVTFLIATIQGINAVGVLLAAAVINIIVYYALPDRYSDAYQQKHSRYFH